MPSCLLDISSRKTLKHPKCNICKLGLLFFLPAYFSLNIRVILDSPFPLYIKPSQALWVLLPPCIGLAEKFAWVFPITSYGHTRMNFGANPNSSWILWFSFYTTPPPTSPLISIFISSRLGPRPLQSSPEEVLWCHTPSPTFSTSVFVKCKSDLVPIRALWFLLLSSPQPCF